MKMAVKKFSLAKVLEINYKLEKVNFFRWKLIRAAMILFEILISWQN